MNEERSRSGSPGALDPHERLVSIDVLRGIALFGVMAVNLVTEFRVSIFQQFLPDAASGSTLDHVTETFVRVALHTKAFSLFSFLFGVSLAMLFERLAPTGRPLYWLSRRLAVLLALGLVHLVFIWNGDILTEYAVAGMLVLPVLMAPTAVVASLAAVLLLLFAVIPFPPPPLEWPSIDALRDHVYQATHVYATGGAGEIWRFSVGELRLILCLHAFVFPRTLVLFLLGVVAWRVRLFDGTLRDRRFLSSIAIIGCATGGLLTAAEYAGARLTYDALGPFRQALPRLAPLILALGYGAAIVAFMQSRVGETRLSVFAPIGRMAFTNYVLQSLVFGFVFFGYGLGYFGQLGAFATLVLGTAVFAIQCSASAVWLSHFRFGPLEWLWRSLMYGRAQPMKQRRALAANER